MEGPYDVHADQKNKFKIGDFNQYLKLFQAKDANSDGTIDKTELSNMLKDLGHRETTADDVSSLLAQIDLNADDKISFSEFLEFIHKMTEEAKDADNTETVMSTNKEGKEFMAKIGESGTKHSYSLEEVDVFAKVINDTLKDDALCNSMAKLPIDSETDALFKACDDGVIFCKLANMIVKDTVDERAINEAKNIFQQQENLNMAISAIKSVGCKVISVDAELIMKGTPHLILGLLWQLVRLVLIKDIDLKNVPELIRLCEDDEEISDLLALSQETILIRWVNFHMKESGSER